MAREELLRELSGELLRSFDGRDERVADGLKEAFERRRLFSRLFGANNLLFDLFPKEVNF